MKTVGMPCGKACAADAVRVIEGINIVPFA
jgi:hypothetical protein